MDCYAQFACNLAGNQAPPSSALRIPESETVQPIELNHRLQAGFAARSLVLQVGLHLASVADVDSLMNVVR
jgi:hypothetical protein